MKMNEIRFESAQPPIDGYAPGGFRVLGAFREGAVLIAPSGLADWPATGVGALDAPEALEPLLSLSGAVDVVLIGAGAEIVAPPAGARRTIEEAGLGLEVMSTPSACRTYNVLLSEGRRVAAALIPLKG